MIWRLLIVLYGLTLAMLLGVAVGAHSPVAAQALIGSAAAPVVVLLAGKLVDFIRHGSS